jgi:TRAP-type C4-dicarboxylate transport system permease small subunit
LELEMIHALIVSVIAMTVLLVTLVMLRMAMSLNFSVAEEMTLNVRHSDRRVEGV